MPSGRPASRASACSTVAGTARRRAAYSVRRQRQGAFELGGGGGRVGRRRLDAGQEAVEGGHVAAERRNTLDGGLDQGGTGAGERVVDERARGEPTAQQHLDQLRRVLAEVGM